MVERTCQECGETWTLKAALAHDRHSGMGRRGFTAGTVRAAQRTYGCKYDSCRQQQMAEAEAHRRDAEADRDLDARRQLGSCPKCGSGRYTERRVRRLGRQGGAARASWPTGAS